MNEIDLSEEEQKILSIIKSAREIEDYLWGENNEKWNLREWILMLRKRIVKIENIDYNNPHAAIELRKRVMQMGAVSVAFLKKIDKDGIPPETCDIPSNLQEYEDKD